MEAQATPVTENRVTGLGLLRSQPEKTPEDTGLQHYGLSQDQCWLERFAAGRGPVIAWERRRRTGWRAVGHPSRSDQKNRGS